MDFKGQEQEQADEFESWSRLVGVEILREKGMDLEYVLQVESDKFTSGLMGYSERPYLCRTVVMYFPICELSALPPETSSFKSELKGK